MRSTLALIAIAIASPTLAQSAMPSRPDPGMSQKDFTSSNAASADRTKRVTRDSRVRIKPSGEVVTPPPR